MMAFFPGVFEVFSVVFLGGMFSSGGLLGMPPGERDATLVRCVGEEAIIYVEWAARTAGKPNGKGIDGLAADPEVQAFVADVKRAILTAVQKESGDSNDPVERTLAEALPPIVLSIINRPGCLSVSYDASKVKLDPEVGPNPIAFIAGLQVTIVINAGDSADEVAKNAQKILQFLPAELRTENMQKQRLPIPLPGGNLMIHRHENYFIVGFGDGAIDNAIAGIKHERKGLTANKRFNDAFNAVKLDRLSTVSWLDVKGVLQRVTTILGDQGKMVSHISKAVGADAIESIVSVVGVTDGQVDSRAFVTTGGSLRGILALAAGRAIKNEDLTHIPIDSDLVIAFTLNLPKVLEAVQQVLQDIEPASAQFFELMLAAAEAELGLSLKDDVFAALGDVWTIYDSPSAGGVLVTSLVAGVEVKNAEKAYRVLSQLMRVLKASLPGDRGGRRGRGVFLGEHKFEDRTIYYINTVGDDIPFAPAFCVTNTHLLMALTPQNLKSHLRYVAGEPKTSFTDRMQVEVPDGDVLKFAYIESKTAIRYLYSFMPYVGQLIFSQIQREGGEIDIFSLPSARAILPYMSDSTARVIRTKTGLRIDQSGPLPIGPGSVVVLNVPVFFFLSVSDRRMQIQQIEKLENDAPEGAAQAPRRGAIAPPVVIPRLRLEAPKPARAVAPARIIVRPKATAKPIRKAARTGE
ncbi:MAG: hypothetical protein O3A00_05465 [Planctomycetota bacterium]|nr:hypothetical protein [Planctomycetota bacterium]